MSVPVRYSAAANYAVADSGSLTTNTFNNIQQQQYQQYANQELYNSNLFNQQQHHHYQQQEEVYGYNNILEEQQQLMQQSTSMSVSVKPSSEEDLQVGAVNNSAIAYHMDQEQATTSAKAREMLAAGQVATSSAMAAAAAAESANTGAIMNGNAHNAEMRTEWMSDEGRCGTPGAAGLDYQKFELEQQQHPTGTTPNLMDQTIEPSLTDNENMNKSSSNNNDLVDKIASMSNEEIYQTLKEYEVLQDKYHTILFMPKESKREVTAGGRDGSAYVLRCLKIWYELPSDVLFSAMTLVDRFLDYMTVKPKHMACLSVAAFHLAIKKMNLKPIPAEDLVNISQCGCTAGDLERMANVIANKLGIPMDYTPITSVTFLRIYFVLFRNLVYEIGGPIVDFYNNFIKLDELENRLEVLLCNVKTTVVAPSTLALTLFCLHLDFHIKASYTRGKPELKCIFEYILFLQKLLRIPDNVFNCGFSAVGDILIHYNGQNKQPYKQRLVWKLSSRTLRVLRPTNRFSTDLPTIDEGITNAMDDGLRSRTESVSSEEEEDWPTSPIIPIFEQC